MPLDGFKLFSSANMVKLLDLMSKQMMDISTQINIGLKLSSMRTFVGYENAHKYALKNIFTICTYNSPST
jgi:hypothetical protein